MQVHAWPPQCFDTSEWYTNKPVPVFNHSQQQTHQTMGQTAERSTSMMKQRTLACAPSGEAELPRLTSFPLPLVFKTADELLCALLCSGATGATRDGDDEMNPACKPAIELHVLLKALRPSKLLVVWKHTNDMCSREQLHLRLVA
jgi:hypothetical protein